MSTASTEFIHTDDVRGMQLFVTQASPYNVCLHRLLRRWLPPDTRQISMIGKVAR